MHTGRKLCSNFLSNIGHNLTGLREDVKRDRPLPPVIEPIGIIIHSQAFRNGCLRNQPNNSFTMNAENKNEAVGQMPNGVPEADHDFMKVILCNPDASSDVELEEHFMSQGFCRNMRCTISRIERVI
jgi:hypothetical protein